MEHIKQGRNRHLKNFQEELYFRNLKKRETFVARVRDGATNNLGSKGITGPILDTKMEGTYLIGYFISLITCMKKSFRKYNSE
jgi:hypothetical protein